MRNGGEIIVEYLAREKVPYVRLLDALYPFRKTAAVITWGGEP
jgi:hypothetical protein